MGRGKRQSETKTTGAATQPQNAEQVLAYFIRKFEKTYGGKMWLTKFVWGKGISDEWYLTAVFNWVPRTSAPLVRLKFSKTIPDRNISNYELEIENVSVLSGALPYKRLAYLDRLAPKSEGKPFHEVLRHCLETLAFNIEDFSTILKTLFQGRQHSEIYRHFISDLTKVFKGEYTEKGWRWRLKLLEVTIEREDYGDNKVYTFLKAYTYVVLQKGFAVVWLPLNIVYHLISDYTGKLAVLIPLPPIVEEHEAAFLMVKEPFLSATTSDANTIFSLSLEDLEDEDEEALSTPTRMFPVTKENLEDAISQIVRNVIDLVLEPAEPFDVAKQKAVKVLSIFFATAIVLRGWLTFASRLRQRVKWEQSTEPPEVFFEGDLIYLRARLRLLVPLKEETSVTFSIICRGRELKKGFTLHFSFEPAGTRFSPFEQRYANINLNDTNQIKGVLRDFAEKVRAQFKRL